MEREKVEKEVKEKGTKLFSEFKSFIAKGNVVDLAVGVIIGGAFGKIVTSMVEDILTPIIGAIVGGIDFTNLSIKVGSAVINYGKFIQNVIDFLIVAICIFIFIKIIEKFNKKKEEAAVEVAQEKRDEKVVLLEQIRDLLQKENSEHVEEVQEVEKIN